MSDRTEAAPDASEDLVAALAKVATCPALPRSADDAPTFWPARCLPRLAFGANVVVVPTT